MLHRSSERNTVQHMIQKCTFLQKGLYSLVFEFLIPWLVPIMSETGSTGGKFLGMVCHGGDDSAPSGSLYYNCHQQHMTGLFEDVERFSNHTFVNSSYGRLQS